MRPSHGIFIAAFIVLLLLPAAGPAKELEMNSLLTPPPVGCWSLFRLTGENGEKTRQFYTSAVSAQEYEGKPHLWLELTSVGEDGDSLSVMGLYPAGNQLGLVAKKVVLKTGGGVAQEVPANLVRVGAMLASKFGLGIDFEELAVSIQKNLDEGLTIEDEAKGTLFLGRRTVTARKIRVEDSHGREALVWLSPEIPLFSFARAEYEGHVLELVDWGANGAVSRIGGNYQPFDLGEIMKRMMGK